MNLIVGMSQVRNNPPSQMIIDLRPKQNILKPPTIAVLLLFCRSSWFALIPYFHYGWTLIIGATVFWLKCNYVIFLKKNILLDWYFWFVSSHSSFSLHFSSLAFAFSFESIVLLSTPVLAVPSRTLILRFNAKSVRAVFKGVYDPFFLSLAAYTVRESNPCSYGHRSKA